MPGKSFHMHFVNDELRGGPTERRVPLPIVQVWIYHYALHGCSHGIAWFPGSLTRVALRHDNTASVRVKQKLLCIETHALPRIEGSMSPVSVKLPGAQAGNKDMPIVVGSIGC